MCLENYLKNKQTAAYQRNNINLNYPNGSLIKTNQNEIFDIFAQTIRPIQKDYQCNVKQVSHILLENKKYIICFDYKIHYFHYTVRNYP